jgi:protein TonB
VRHSGINDRLAVSLVLAMGIHAALVLGLGFILEIGALDEAEDSLDVVLVNFSSEEAPEDIDFLAQANQKGGGDAVDAERPTQEISSVVPSEGAGLMPATAEPLAAEQTADTREQLVTDGAQQVVPDETDIEQPPVELPSVAELMRQRMEIAELQARLERERAFESRLKRRRFISANTREYEFATYMQAWVSKVERVGNLNYPTEIRRRRLVGDLLMTVGINPDGSVESIDIRRSSGMPELDEAALSIVRLASPFAPLPPDIRAKVDVLHITRTWKFSTGHRFE